MNRGLWLIGVLVIFMSSVSNAQTSLNNYPSQNWFNEDPKGQKVNGVSTEEAYRLLLGKKSTTVIVAVMFAHTSTVV